MRVVITGAAGFAARHLICAIEKEGRDEIFAWVKDEQEARLVSLDEEHIYIADITDEKKVREGIETIRPQLVYHLAAQASVGLSWKLPALTMEVNTVGTIHLLEALRSYSPEAKLLLVGSAEQYGKVTKDQLPIKETRELEGINPYSVSKMTQELMAQMYATGYNMHIVMVRSFNHIGPGQAVNFVIPDWCSQIAAIENGKQAPVLRVGNIQVKRDFTDVRDIVRAYMQLIEHGTSGEVYNVGSGVSYSLEQILQKIIKASTRQDIHYETDHKKLRPADVEELRADITKLKQTISWNPIYTIEQSLEDILEEMRNKVKHYGEA